LKNEAKTGTSAGTDAKSASTLIDSENNQYVLSKSNDPTAHIEDAKFFHDMIILVMASSAFGLIFHLLRLPPFFGYMLAGIVLGPAQFNKIKVTYKDV
jgi:hypothetical protein